ncbi:MAG: hypothetical protein FWF05_00945 [Oscillospiraceae bacterium]|nr:hypothetical protein [Oscillospiraceae bacterium]
MKALQKLLYVGLCALLLTGVCAVGAAAYNGIIPAHTKSYTAKYEITVDSWDYSFSSGESGTVESDAAYKVGPLDTTIYLLGNGKYWLDQLYSHEVQWVGEVIVNPVIIGYSTGNMLGVLGEANGWDYLDSNASDHTKFYIWDGEDEVFVPTYLTDRTGVDAGVYADPFEVSELPGTVRFKVFVPKGVSYNPDCTFYGTIKFTGVKEVVPPSPPTIWDRIISFFTGIWNWIVNLFNFF